jgi:hypothetical protein
LCNADDGGAAQKHECTYRNCPYFFLHVIPF